MLPQIQSLLDKVITKDVFDSISVIAANVNKSLKSLSSHSSHRGRKMKYSNEQILRILVLKELLHISLRDMVKSLHFNDSYRKACMLEKHSIPSLATSSYRNARTDYNALIQKTIMLYELETSKRVELTTVDSTMVKPCLEHRAQLQRKRHKYTDKNASWTMTTKVKWEYGYKVHISCDNDSSMILKYSFATAKEHDSTHFKDVIDSLKTSRYFLLDKAYDSNEIYHLILNHTSAIPIIDINRRKDSSKPTSKDKNIRWIMKNIRIKYKSLYKKRWEIERINSNLKSPFMYSLEYICSTPSLQRDCWIKTVSS
ncbi:transposase [Mesoaciditoga lauensis]|uniref:transposase n=1 Tax=Mesoaciditoga lauensis TaxID=1495039 RepID=UPI00056323AB|nr:transposase [Mesoaciditoga lauensis]